MTALLLRDVEVEGARADVRVRDGRVVELGPALRRDGEPVLDGRGGAVLPGLHDHHVHLLALAAALTSVRVDPVEAPDATAFAATVRAAAARGQVRAVGYHDSVAGQLDRETLDAIVADVPVRVQHRSGAAWFLNSAALHALAGDAGDEAVERDDGGRPTGRVHRGDHLFRRDDATLPDLRPVGALLSSYGVTGVTDATPRLDRRALPALRAADVPQHRFLLGAPLDDPASRGVPWKILLDESRGLDVSALTAEVAAAHAAARPVAVHCVTAAEAVATVAALRETGAMRGDRIEHGAVLARDLDDDLRALGVTVVTQPNLVAERGDDYLRDVDAADLPHLYRCRTLLDGGVAVAAGTDAPYGDPDPWAAVAAATTRRTRGGRAVGAGERLSPRRALELFLSAPLDPGGPPRRVAVGAEADLCVLHVPVAQALADPAARHVAATVVGGVVVHRADAAG